MTFPLPSLTSEFYGATAPILILGLGGLLSMLQAVTPRFSGPRAVFSIMITALVAALGASLAAGALGEVSYLDGSYLAGDLTRFGHVIILVVATLIALLVQSSYLAPKFFRGEVTSLYLMVIAGMLVMVASEDLVTIFVGLELSSIGLYALVGYVNPAQRSQEAAIKYFVLGSFAAALLLFGFALLYGATGSMRLSDLLEQLPKLAEHNWVRLGVLFIVVGLGFKLALAPFHLWAPDTYEGAPTAITALMATTVKVMIMMVALRLFAATLAPVYETWTPALMFAAALSVILGNIMALVQLSLKRMLAYSSVAHSGYMAIAICAMGGNGGEFPVAAILYYIVSYVIISLGAFGVLIALESEGMDNLTLDDLSGLAKKRPWAAAALAVSMFSFAGMPPTVGFMGKFFVFNAALANQLYSLVIIGAIGSAISLFYYLRVVVRMYMTEPSSTGGPLAQRRSWLSAGIIGLLAVANLLLGTVFPGAAMKSMLTTSQEVALQRSHPAAAPMTAAHAASLPR